MTNEKKRLWATCCVMLITALSVWGQSPRERWVDSTFQTLDQQGKIGQLFMTRVSSHASRDFIRDISKRISSGEIGSVIFTTGTPSRQLHLTHMLQGEANVPLLIAQDGATGLGPSLDSALVFP